MSQLLHLPERVHPPSPFSFSAGLQGLAEAHTCGVGAGRLLYSTGQIRGGFQSCAQAPFRSIDCSVSLERTFPRITGLPVAQSR